MDHHIKLLSEEPAEVCGTQVKGMHHNSPGLQICLVALFEVHRIVIGEIIDPHDLMSKVFQPLGRMGPDKSGSTCDQYFHLWV